MRRLQLVLSPLSFDDLGGVAWLGHYHPPAARPQTEQEVEQTKNFEGSNYRVLIRKFHRKMNLNIWDERKNEPLAFGFC